MPAVWWFKVKEFRMGQTGPGIEIKEWLASAGVLELISKIAGQVAADLKKRKISPFFLDRDLQINESQKDLLSTITSELALFILEDRSHIRNMILSGDPNAARALRNRFINFCLDRARSPDRDPYRYLYKRACDILRQSESFYTRAEHKKGLAFSIHPENRSIPALCREDFESVSWPVHIVNALDYDAVNRKTVLPNLATYFWNCIAAVWGSRQIWVAMRDFINWIGLHVPLNPPRPEETMPEGTPPIENVPDSHYQPNEIPIDLEFISKCAACAANLLNDREKEIFYCRWGLGLSLKDIADRLGYKGSSGPKHFLDNAEDELRRFLRDKPGLAPDDLDDQAFAIFRENLFAILKERVLKP
jgi:hypothetical protein